MKLLSTQTDEASLLHLGSEAVSLLEKRNFQSLADRFGYALAFGRSPATAIEEELLSCVAEFRASSERPPPVAPSMIVKYFHPNSSNLFALVECVFIATEGCPILAEVIVIASGKDKHATLEEVSLATVDVRRRYAPSKMNTNEITLVVDRLCLREPIPEIADAARYLDAAVSAHRAGRTDLAESLIRLADMPAIREWTESLWGTDSPHIHYRVIAGAPPSLPLGQRTTVRMPITAEKQLLHRRDGYHCRFCGIPVIRTEIRQAIKKVYPAALPWGKKNFEQHAAFQAMWLQYDHLLAHARGGNNDLDNLLITCAPCNFGRWNKTFEEVGLRDPRTREPVRSTWDGLERFLQ